MKTIALSVAAIAFAGFAFAQDKPVVEDADDNGSYSIDEIKLAYPDITDEVYTSIDTNADGSVDAEELAAAEAAGTLVAG